MTYFDETKPYWGNATQPLIAVGKERLTARSVKIFADGRSPYYASWYNNVSKASAGALRTGGSAVNKAAVYTACEFSPSNIQLYEPYADNPTTSGFMRIEPEILHDVIPKFLRDGWQVVCFDKIIFLLWLTQFGR